MSRRQPAQRKAQCSSLVNQLLQVRPVRQGHNHYPTAWNTWSVLVSSVGILWTMSRTGRSLSHSPDRFETPYDTRVIDLSQDRYLAKRVGRVFARDVDHLDGDVTPVIVVAALWASRS